MLFLRNKLKSICLNWISDNSEYFRSKIDSLITNNQSPSEEDCLQAYKNSNNLYFKKATELINNYNVPDVKLRWANLPIHPDACGFEIDYNNISIGIIYIMLYYCFSGTSASKKDIQIYTELNHINHDIRSQILKEFIGE